MSETLEAANLETAMAYLRAIETNADLGPFLHEDVVQEEMPNKLTPKGARHDRAAMLTRSEEGKKLMRAQRYELLHSMAKGDRVALEVDWTGTLAIGIGERAAGSEMRCRFAIFLEMKDGRIVGIRNYDCFPG